MQLMTVERAQSRLASLIASRIKGESRSTIRRQQNRPAGMSMPKKDAFAFRYCGCLSCEIITLVLDRQPETRSANWNTHEVLHALSEASAFFCNGPRQQHGASGGRLARSGP